MCKDWIPKQNENKLFDFQWKQFCLLNVSGQVCCVVHKQFDILVKCGETVRFASYCIVYKQINILRKCGEMWGNCEVCYDVCLFTNEFLFGSLLYQLVKFGRIKLQFSLRAHWRRFSSFLFLELFAQPGRACLLCFTPEFDKVLVSLAHRCLGASLCQVRVWSSANSWFPVVSPENPYICWDSWEINFLVSPFPPPLAKVFPQNHHEYG